MWSENVAVYIASPQLPEIVIANIYGIASLLWVTFFYIWYHLGLELKLDSMAIQAVHSYKTIMTVGTKGRH